MKKNVMNVHFNLIFHPYLKDLKRTLIMSQQKTYKNLSTELKMQE